MIGACSESVDDLSINRYFALAQGVKPGLSESLSCAFANNLGAKIASEGVWCLLKNFWPN